METEGKCTKGREGMKKWIEPLDGLVKLNKDASLFVAIGENSSGTIIRDHSGRVLLLTWKVNKICATVEGAEAKACFEGI